MTGHEPPRASPRFPVRPALSTLAAAGVCLGMLSIAVLFPPRDGGAATAPEGLVDRAGWSRLGSLERADVRIDILARDGQRRYTVWRDGRLAEERLTAEELRRRWGVDTRSMHADDAPGLMMMVNPDAPGHLGR